MEAVIVLLVLGGAGYGIYVLNARASQASAAAAAAGRVLHLRGASFPATCSWCKNTGLAHKLIVFERVDERWTPFDVRAGLAAMPDDHVEPLTTAMFRQHHPRWRRFCTEKCTREFFAAEHVDAVTAFGACAYCSTRFPMTVVHCPNCAARRQG